MPKLWDETIEAHRGQVRDAILDAAASLAFEQGFRAVTMARIAERAGIGRATLYKYFPDVEAILRTWHARQIDAHITELTHVRDGAGTASRRLNAVLSAYAHIVRQTGGHDRDLVAFLHPDEHIAHARTRLRELIRDLIEQGAAAGEIRTDVTPAELAVYCLHALSAAAELHSGTELTGLVAVTTAGLQPPG
ncbi:TetR/AcrR family transcriptional regulator [Nocardia vaccinii]|uniref:TetR/AcrR family transcriptional regulator n=1 Tax=Nocardia vaccinii TaxID=1822 RepID=UPI00082DC42E|nr:TetR/AcrR family transcriptional regulator [Nocardia vaccinii]